MERCSGSNARTRREASSEKGSGDVFHELYFRVIDYWYRNVVENVEDNGTVWGW